MTTAKSEIGGDGGRSVLEQLKWLKSFVEYARYELQPGEAKPGSQFPHQADADKAIAILTEMIAVCTNESALRKAVTTQQIEAILPFFDQAARATTHPIRSGYHDNCTWRVSLTLGHARRLLKAFAPNTAPATELQRVTRQRDQLAAKFIDDQLAASAEPVNWKASYEQACDDADAEQALAGQRLAKMEQNWRSCQHEVDYLRKRLAIAKASSPVRSTTGESA